MWRLKPKGSAQDLHAELLLQGGVHPCVRCGRKVLLTLLVVAIALGFAGIFTLVPCTQNLGGQHQLPTVTMAQGHRQLVRGQQVVQQTRLWQSMQSARRAHRFVEVAKGHGSKGCCNVLLHTQMSSTKKVLVPKAYNMIITCVHNDTSLSYEAQSSNDVETIRQPAVDSKEVPNDSNEIEPIAQRALVAEKVPMGILQRLWSLLTIFVLRYIYENLAHAWEILLRLWGVLGHVTASLRSHLTSRGGVLGHPGPSLAHLGSALVRFGGRRDVWQPGPAEVFSQQAQMLRALLDGRNSNWTMPSSWKLDDDFQLFDAIAGNELQALQNESQVLREQQEEMERNKLQLYENEETLVLEWRISLRRAIDKVQTVERARIVMELLYLNVCRRFKELRVDMIPSLKAGGDVNFGVIDLRGLTIDLYSIDALELVKAQLFSVLGEQTKRSSFKGMTTVLQMALCQASQVYGMSALLGYSLRNFDARFQLEKLAGTLGAWGEPYKGAGPNPFAEDDGTIQSLSNYISSFGPEECKRLAQIASVEAQMAVELQISALFGNLHMLQNELKNAVGTVTDVQDATRKLQQAVDTNKVRSVRITSDDLTRLVLEAVAYGALLRDSEKKVSDFYELTPYTNGDGDDDGGIKTVRPRLPKPCPTGPKVPTQ